MVDTVLITGAARRIGAAIARRFAAGGFQVAIHYSRSELDARALKAELGSKAELLKADLSRPEAAAETVARFAQTHPDLSVLVNNASIFDADSANAPSRAVWKTAEAVNLWAPIMIAQAFCAARNGRKGTIVNLLDQKLDNLNPDFFSYTLTKAALKAASHMLAQSYAPAIRLCNIAPGLTLPSSDQTEAEYAHAATLNLLQRPNRPEDIAEAVFFAATGPLSSGQTLHVDGGQRFLPLARDVMFATRMGR